jgi:hypothetical protein
LVKILDLNKNLKKILERIFGLFLTGKSSSPSVVGRCGKEANSKWHSQENDIIRKIHIKISPFIISKSKRDRNVGNKLSGIT